MTMKNIFCLLLLGYFSIMSKFNHLYSAEKTLSYQMHNKWGDNVLKACPSMQWALNERTDV